MSFGIPFMLFSFVEPVGQILGKVLDLIIRFENAVIFSFQKLPSARIEHINLPPSEMFLFWGLIISIYLLAVKNQKKYAYLSLILLFGLGLSNWVAWWNDDQRNEIYIYQVGKEMAVDHFYQGKLYSRIAALPPQDVSYSVIPNRISLGHVRSRELRYHEDEKTKSLFLPGGAFLQLNGNGFEVEAPYIRSISLYDGGKWTAWEGVEDKQAAEGSFRVVIR